MSWITYDHLYIYVLYIYIIYYISNIYYIYYYIIYYIYILYILLYYILYIYIYIYIYILEGSGYKNNDVCPKAHEIRLGKENYWMKTLRTTFERIRNNDQKIITLAGESFPLLPVI